MGLRDWPLAGEMNSRITFFENTTAKSASGVVGKVTLNELGTRSAKREDAFSSEDIEGRVQGVDTVTFQVRFDATLFGKGAKLIVRDFDGDFEVIGRPRIMSGQKRYMEFKAQKRG